MLKLQKINKVYQMTNYKVNALNDFSVNFRQNEFVAILGPSGSGKTTLLNLIGGLDQYTSGNLIINGIETKNFKEKDWNVYRSHRVGFVFQSYNLIPHQTVLGNVELALTIAGINKEERITRAKKALDEVGLSDQYYKRPNQLSGGQSQRVAIARALVNDPEILLADEPTGALDSKTSEQIMDLIREIAKDRLVIMVTHNGELANEYASRIIELKDGKLVSDSNPFKGDDKKVLTTTKKEHAKMNLWTSFRLSLQNLFTKKSRTILTAVASAIGIIGISLVLSLSYGVQTYITKTQEDLLSGNPITISESGFDIQAILGSMGPDERIEVIKEINKVGIDQVIKNLTLRTQSFQDSLVSNNINQDYLDFIENIPKEDLASIFYNRQIDVTNNLYMDFIEEDGTITNLSVSALRSLITSLLEHNEDTKAYTSLMSSFTNVLNELPSDQDYILSQYNLLGNSKYATNKNEMLLVLNSNDLVSDLTLTQIGFYSQVEFQNIIFEALEDQENYQPNIPLKTHIDYSEIFNKEFTFHPNDAVYVKKSDMLRPFDYLPYGSQITNVNDSFNLNIVGILELKAGIEYGSLASGLYYTSELSNHIVDIHQTSEIVEYYNENEIEVFTSIDREAFRYGITYDYTYRYLGEVANAVGLVGKVDQTQAFLASMPGAPSGRQQTLTKRDLGGEELPSYIAIYPKDLAHKKNVIAYLDTWNTSDAGIDNPITYSDTLTIIFSMIANIIDIITIALIAFTSLALFVSSVMIAIITYVSVVERVKEIGVIRSLGGSKTNVSNLFISETAIIGFVAALIAIGFTYLATFIINIALADTVGGNIAIFPIRYALLMILISVSLTIISGFVPSRSAAKKDPVDALRSE